MDPQQQLLDKTIKGEDILSPATLIAVPQTLHGFVDDELYTRVVERAVGELDVGYERAELLGTNGFGYLRFLCDNPGRAFVPSNELDPILHIIGAYTIEVNAICAERTGVLDAIYVHAPEDVPGIPAGVGGALETREVMNAQGVNYDTGLWGDVSAFSANPCAYSVAARGVIAIAA